MRFIITVPHRNFNIEIQILLINNIHNDTRYSHLRLDFVCYHTYFSCKCLPSTDRRYFNKNEKINSLSTYKRQNTDNKTKTNEMIKLTKGLDFLRMSKYIWIRFPKYNSTQILVRISEQIPLLQCSHISQRKTFYCR